MIAGYAYRFIFVAKESCSYRLLKLLDVTSTGCSCPAGLIQTLWKKMCVINRWIEQVLNIFKK